VWSGKKTAIAAALAIGFASVGAVGAAAVLPAISQNSESGPGLPGGAQVPQLQNQQGQNQQGVPSGQSQNGTRHFGGGRVPGVPGDDDGGGDDDGSSS
jgi:hypothetical protein